MRHPPITLTEEERKKLTQLAKSRKASVRLARHAHMILRAADGESSAMIAAALGVGRVQVGLAAITEDRPRGGRPMLVNNAHIAHLTTQTDPEGATQWSTQSLAAKAGVSDSTVLRVWRQHGLKPHLVKALRSRGTRNLSTSSRTS